MSLARLGLLVALLPSALYFGHWSLSLPLGNSGYVLVLVPPVHDPGGDGHAQHCHGDAGSCADGQATAPVPVAVLAEAGGEPVAGPAFHHFDWTRESMPSSVAQLPPTPPPRPSA